MLMIKSRFEHLKTTDKCAVGEIFLAAGWLMEKPLRCFSPANMAKVRSCRQNDGSESDDRLGIKSSVK